MSDTTTPFARLTRNSQGIRVGRSLLSALGRTMISDETPRQLNTDPPPVVPRMPTMQYQPIVHDVEVAPIPVNIQHQHDHLFPPLRDQRQPIHVETVHSDDTDDIATIHAQINDVTDDQHFSDQRPNNLMYRLCNLIGLPVSTLTKQILANIGVETDTALVQLTSYNPGELFWYILLHPTNEALTNIYPRQTVQNEVRELVLTVCRIRMLFLEYSAARLDPATGQFEDGTGFDTLSLIHDYTPTVESIHKWCTMKQLDPIISKTQPRPSRQNSPMDQPQPRPVARQRPTTSTSQPLRPHPNRPASPKHPTEVTQTLPTQPVPPPPSDPLHAIQRLLQPPTRIPLPPAPTPTPRATNQRASPTIAPFQPGPRHTPQVPATTTNSSAFAFLNPNQHRSVNFSSVPTTFGADSNSNNDTHVPPVPPSTFGIPHSNPVVNNALGNLHAHNDLTYNTTLRQNTDLPLRRLGEHSMHLNGHPPTYTSTDRDPRQHTLTNPATDG